jgi:alpha-glucosidase (family GH31 glycosyl hydrolase)
VRHFLRISGGQPFLFFLPRANVLHCFAALAILAASLSGIAQQHSQDVSEKDNPIANPTAIIILDHARFTVLTSRMIRMEWDANGKFEDHASLVFINRRLPVPKFQKAITTSGGSQQLSIDTDDLKLTYSASGDGKFNADNLKVSFTLNGKDVAWKPGTPGTGNLQGTTRTLDGALGDQTREPIGPGLVSRDGWVVVDDSARPLFDSADFSFSKGEDSPWPWVMPRPGGDHQDWYFFGYGHDYKQALGDYVRVAGRIPLPPLFAFGAWWSRYWAYTDQELDDLVKGFRQNSVPLDVLVIDMDWHLNKDQLEARGEKDPDQSGHDLGWSGYSWNNVLFPDPKLFLDHIHQEGLKTTLNLHPASGVQPWEDAYPAFAKAMGIDPATKQYVPFDITDKKFAINYMDLLHHPLEKKSIDFWWLDWQQEANTQLAGVNPTWWLNYVHFTDQEREGKRPLLFHRWGGLGNHRYQIGFSGDTISVWQSLAFQPWFTATAANVGYAYWSHDIGGHMPGAVDPQLYTRWIQFGALSPILRTHTTKNPEAERRIWAYPEPYSNIMRTAFQQRYAMQPYIYTEGRRTYDTGVAFFHPLYYDWPEAPEAYTQKNEYLFGDNMLVAPITTPVDNASQLSSQNVWIPPGEWVESATGTHFTGPKSITRYFSISQVPAYTRAGTIIPMQPAMEYSGEKPVDPLILQVTPLDAGQTSTYTLYEDGSHARDYQQGLCAWTKLTASQKGDDLVVQIAPIDGHYPGMPLNRGYELRLPGDWAPESVTVNGTHLDFERKEGQPGWRYEGNTLTTIITIPQQPVADEVTVNVRRTRSSFAKRGELDGFAGSMARFRNAYDTINEATSRGVLDPLLFAMQTGDRLGYQPESTATEMAQRENAFKKAVASVQEMVAVADSDQQVAKLLSGQNVKVQPAQEQITRYRLLMHRALTQTQDAQSR